MSAPIIVRVSREIESLIPRFLELRRHDVQALARAIAQSDLDTVKRIGHSLKGVGGGYGFDEITRLGGRIEDAALAGDMQTALAVTSEYQAYIEAVQVEYV